MGSFIYFTLFRYSLFRKDKHDSSEKIKNNILSIMKKNPHFRQSQYLLDNLIKILSFQESIFILNDLIYFVLF